MTKIPIISPGINRKSAFEIAQERDRHVVPSFERLPNGDPVEPLDPSLEKALKNSIPYQLKMVSLDGKFWVEAVRINVTLQQMKLNDITYYQPILHYANQSVIVGNLYPTMRLAVGSVLFKRVNAQELTEESDINV